MHSTLSSAPCTGALMVRSSSRLPFANCVRSALDATADSKGADADVEGDEEEEVRMPVCGLRNSSHARCSGRKRLRADALRVA